MAAVSVCHTRIFPLQVNQCRLDPAVSGSLLALPLTRTSIGVWDLADPKSDPMTLIAHKRSVSALAFSHDEPKLLCSTGDDYLIVWYIRKCQHVVAKGQEARGEVILHHPGDVSHVTFSADASRVAMCTEAVVKVVSVSLGKVVAELVGHNAKVTGAAFCPHYSATLVTISDDRTVIVWDVESLSLLFQSAVLTSAPLIALAMNTTEPQVAVSSAGGVIKVFDLADNKNFRQLCHLDVGRMLSKFRQAQPQRKGCTAASDNSAVMVVSKGGVSPKKTDASSPPESGDANFSSIESSDSVLSLLYAYPEGALTKSSAPARSRYASFGPSHDAVGEVLSADSLALVIVSSHCMIQVDSKTLDILCVVDLQESLPSWFQTCAKDVRIGGVGLAGLGQANGGQLFVVVGTQFESRVHSLQWELALSKSKTSADASMGNLESSLSEQHLMAPHEDGAGEASDGLSVMASRPLAEDSPLKAEMTPNNSQGTGAGTGTRNRAGHRGSVGSIAGKKADPMNQPLTFKTKVKSSGYTQAPRTTMFQPKTNARSKSVDAKCQIGKGQSLTAKISSQEYPHDAGPPSELDCKITTGAVSASITGLRFSGTGQNLACCLSNKMSLVFPAPFGHKESCALVGHDGAVNSISWSNSGKCLLTASNDKTAILWDRASSDLLMTFSNLNNNFKDVDKDSNKGPKASGDRYTKEVRGGQFFYRDKFVLLIVGNRLCLYKYHLDPSKDDIKRYLTKSRYKLVKSWDTPSQNFTALSAVNSFYSHLALCAGSNRAVEIYDLNEGRLAHTFADAHTKPVHALTQNEGSAYTSQPQEALNVFATSAIQDCVKVWDVRSRRCVLRLQGHSNQAHGCGIAFSACGTYLASGSEDKLTYVYDVRQGTFCQKLRGHADVVSSVAFHPAKPVLASGSIDGKVILFKA